MTAQNPATVIAARKALIETLTEIDRATPAGDEVSAIVDHLIEVGFVPDSFYDRFEDFSVQQLIPIVSDIATTTEATA